MAKQKKWPSIVTKPGEAKYPHVVVARTTFVPEGEYDTQILWEPEEFEEMELKTIIDQLIDEKYEETIDGLKPKQVQAISKAYPYKDDLDSEGEETGKISVKFKSKASYVNKKTNETVYMKPIIFDAAGQQITRRINIGSGSILCIKTTIKPYFMQSTKTVGVTLYLNAVQVRKLVQFGADAAGMGFDTDGEAMEYPDEDLDDRYDAINKEEAATLTEGDF
jgi:hypothetical protein